MAILETMSRVGLTLSSFPSGVLLEQCDAFVLTLRASEYGLACCPPLRGRSPLYWPRAAHLYTGGILSHRLIHSHVLPKTAFQ